MNFVFASIAGYQFATGNPGVALVLFLVAIYWDRL